METTLESEITKALQETKAHIEEAMTMPLTADGAMALQRRIDAAQVTLSWVRQTLERLQGPEV